MDRWETFLKSFFKCFIISVSCIFIIVYFILNLKKDYKPYSLDKSDCYFDENNKVGSYKDEIYVISSFVGSDEILYSLINLYNKEKKESENKNSTKYKIKYSYLSKNSSYSNISSYISDTDVFVPNIEYIMVERPDWVFSSYYNNINYINNLFYIKQKNCILTKFSTVKDIVSNIDFISSVLGLEKEGKVLIKNIEESIDKVAQKFVHIDKNKKDILIYMYKDFSIGSGTVLDDTLDKLGFTNVMNKKVGFFKIDKEEILTLSKDVDYILVVNSSKFNKKEIKSEIKKSVIKDLKAVKDEKYIFIDEAVAFSVSNYIKDIALSFYDVKY